jgi:hypothetical protein
MRRALVPGRDAFIDVARKVFIDEPACSAGFHCGNNPGRGADLGFSGFYDRYGSAILLDHRTACRSRAGSASLMRRAAVFRS